MKGLSILMLLCVTALNASSSQQSQFRSGQQLGHELKNQVEQIQHNGDMWEMMKPAKDTPAENTAQAAEVQSYLVETAGPRDGMDADHDPLMRQAEGALDNPLQTVRGRQNPIHLATPQYTQKSCEQDVLKDTLTCSWAHDYEVKETEFPRKEGTISFEQHELDGRYTHMVKCGRKKWCKVWSVVNDELIQLIAKRIRTPHQHIIIKKQTTKGWRRTHRIGKRDYAYASYGVSYVVNPYSLYSIKPIKQNNCQELEKLARQGLYRQVKEVCVDQPGENKTRTIRDQSITKACWHFERTYTSPSFGKNTCQPLLKQGCESTHSECVRKVGDTCVRTKHSLRCPTTKPSSLHEGIQKGPMPFCIDGQCAAPSMEEDDQFEDMLPQMALLSELSKVSKEEGVHIFSGRALSCQKTWFKKCCGVGKSFIQQMTGSQCGGSAKTLAALRGKGYCHYVGSKPVKKKIGPIKKTIGHEEVYCCYPSVLLKAFNEQGRHQLNTGWGDANRPVCHGFTVSQIQHLDFGKMDLGEAYQEVTQKITPIAGQRQQNISRDVQSRIQRSL